MNLFRFIPGYSEHVYEAGKEPLLLMLVGFLVAFLLTRSYTRIARVRGWGSTHVGDVHMHHVIVGIVLMTAAGVIGFGFAPGEVFLEWLAIAFGVGAALTLDEFAMVFHLEDVYWSTEGRASVDAVVTATVILLLGLVATAPFGAERGEEPAWEFWFVIGLNVIFVVVTFLKGKMKLALAGVVFPLFAMIGAFRLAKPRSWWGRRFYDPSGEGRRGRKYRRAVRREAKRRERWEARQTRLYDTVGGAPSRPSPREASDGPEIDSS
jgi:lysyl-tRNA synthetase class 2